MTSVHVAPDCSFRQSIYNVIKSEKKQKRMKSRDIS